MRKITDMLARCSQPNESRPFPPTLLYNEGWMLRLVLDWFAQAGDKMASHPLGIPNGCRWYSEALLPSQFKPRKRGDGVGESHTHADGVIGHFKIGGSGRGDLWLPPEATHFVILEAKMYSPLSAGTRNAPEYNQVARNVACMANVLSLLAGKTPSDMIRLGFFVLAPESQILQKKFDKALSLQSIRSAVAQRVIQYEGHPDHTNLQGWFDQWFEPTLTKLGESLRPISWESIISDILKEDEETGKELEEFYRQCKQYNPQPGSKSHGEATAPHQMGNVKTCPTGPS
jgi:hypothetical protein